MEVVRFVLHHPLKESLDRLHHDSDFAAAIVSLILFPIAVVTIALIFISANSGDEEDVMLSAKAKVEEESKQRAKGRRPTEFGGVKGIKTD